MRAPPWARMVAVAAPSPDAEPVTIAYKPSFDIVSSCCPEAAALLPRWSTISRGETRANSPKLHCAELEFPQAPDTLPHMSVPQAPLRRALVRTMAFPHHPVQERIARQRLAGRCVPIFHIRGTLWRRVKTSSS